VAVLARPPCPHDTYPQFGSRGEEQGGTYWPSTAAPPCDAKTQGTSQKNRRTAVLAPAHGADTDTRTRRNCLVRRLSPPPPPEGERIQRFKP
jgi:hypothetical protein